VEGRTDDPFVCKTVIKAIIIVVFVVPFAYLQIEYMFEMVHDALVFLVLGFNNKLGSLFLFRHWSVHSFKDVV
jgi:hypothetical protein